MTTFGDDIYCKTINGVGTTFVKDGEQLTLTGTLTAGVITTSGNGSVTAAGTGQVNGGACSFGGTTGNGTIFCGSQNAAAATLGFYGLATAITKPNVDTGLTGDEFTQAVVDALKSLGLISNDAPGA